MVYLLWLKAMFQFVVRADWRTNYLLLGQGTVSQRRFPMPKGGCGTPNTCTTCLITLSVK